MDTSWIITLPLERGGDYEVMKDLSPRVTITVQRGA